MDTQQLNGCKTINLNINPVASPTEEATGGDFIGRKLVLKKCMNILLAQIKFQITIL